MMQEDKWYKKALIYLIIVIFSPLILIGLIIFGITTLFQAPTLKKEYKKSRYYSDIKRKFNLSITNSPEYRFYNSAVKRDLPIVYRRQDSNGFEYFVYNGTLFLFPDFYDMDLDEDTGKWRVAWHDERADFSERFKKLKAKLDTVPDCPVKVLCERKLFRASNLQGYTLPEEVYLTSGYELAFDGKDSPLDIIIPQTTRELYNMMVQNPDLCGSYEMTADEDDYGSIFWTLGDACFELCVGRGQGYISVSVNGLLQGKIRKDITHWHPDPDEIYDEVIKIGKRGNITVLSSYWGGGALLYSGKKGECPYLPPKKHLMRKYYYIEAE